MSNKNFAYFLSSVQTGTFEDESPMKELDITALSTLYSGLEHYKYWSQKESDFSQKQIGYIEPKVLEKLTPEHCETYKQLLLHYIFEYCTNHHPQSNNEEQNFIYALVIFDTQRRKKLFKHYLREEYIYSLSFYQFLGHRVIEAPKRKKIYARLSEVVKRYLSEEFSLPITVEKNELIWQILLYEFKRRLTIGKDNLYIKKIVNNLIGYYVQPFKGAMTPKKTHTLVNILAEWVNKNNITPNELLSEFKKKEYIFIGLIFERAEEFKEKEKYEYGSFGLLTV